MFVREKDKTLHEVLQEYLDDYARDRYPSFDEAYLVDKYEQVCERLEEQGQDLRGPKTRS